MASVWRRADPALDVSSLELYFMGSGQLLRVYTGYDQLCVSESLLSDSVQNKLGLEIGWTQADLLKGLFREFGRNKRYL